MTAPPWAKNKSNAAEKFTLPATGESLEISAAPTIELLPSREKEESQVETKTDAEKEAMVLGPTPAAGVATAWPKAVKSERLVKIETILEADLAEVYFRLEPKLQQQFKVKGEVTATKIEKILSQTKFKAKDIFHLIIDWLKIIPGINKFFIRQEAKIKTNKILELNKNKS